MSNSKIARIRFENRDEESGYEGFVLETWDAKRECWCCVVNCECRRSLDFPNEKNKDFIHWSILREITKLSMQGYHIDM